jgi:ABC-type transport system substrate-binding protein
MPGMAVAHSIIAPGQADYAHVESRIVRFEHDARRAIQLVESVGFQRGTDGGYRDPAGGRLSVEIRTTTNDANQKSVFAIADYWQRIGVAGEPVVIPVQLLQNREYRATYPGLELVNQPAGVGGIESLLHSSSAPTPERNYQAPTSSRNRGQYMNPEYDALMDSYRMTIPNGERMQILGELLHHQTDLQLVTGVFYTADAIMIANRLQHVPAGSTWNAHLWEVR